MIMRTMRIVVHDNNQELSKNKANNMHNENGQDIRYASVTVRTAVINTITYKRDSKPEKRETAEDEEINGEQRATMRDERAKYQYTTIYTSSASLMQTGDGGIMAAAVCARPFPYPKGGEPETTRDPKTRRR